MDIQKAISIKIHLVLLGKEQPHLKDFFNYSEKSL